jgi:hypothetical protein
MVHDLIKFGPKVKEILRKKSKDDAANKLDDVIKESKKHVDDLDDGAKLGNGKYPDGGANPKFTYATPKLMNRWMKTLKKRGVKFEIGTRLADGVLDAKKSDGLFTSIYNPKTKKYDDITIYLRENPSTAVFLEETYHALQFLNNVPDVYKTVIYNGVKYPNVDNWEFLAKKQILDEAVTNKISYDEYKHVERQLQEVLDGTY